MNTLLLGSENRGKLVEIQSILKDLPVTLVLPAEVGISLEVVEDGQTYADNAVLKAHAYQRASGLVTLADDSGLEVDALDGRPGLQSHRFSTLLHASDADRPWLARFRCAVAIAVPAGQIYVTTGDCPGEIIPTERGQDGFGYDPIFFMPEYQATMAELGREVKNRISHRAHAVQAARPLLHEIFGL
jgi:XTP/dITP diphosphohydrolase